MVNKKLVLIASLAFVSILIISLTGSFAYVFLTTNTESKLNLGVKAGYWAKYNVSLVTGDTGSEPVIIEVNYHDNYPALPEPTRPGYTFTGWYTDETGGTRVNSSTLEDIMGDHNLYARWNPNTISVTYNANGGEGTTNKTSYVYEQGTTWTNTQNGFTKTGYTFTGWKMNRVYDSKWYGCSNQEACTSGNTSLDWYPSSSITNYFIAANSSSLPTNISPYDITNYAEWTDTTVPTASIATSGTTGTSALTANLTLKDNAGVTKYYFGTTNPSNNTVTYTDITSTTSTTVSKTISSAGTYYVQTMDAAGNTSTVTSVVCYNVTFASNNTSLGTVSIASYIVKSGTTYSTSTSTFTLSDGRKVTGTPVTSSEDGYSNKFSSWSKTSGTISAATSITATFTHTANTYTITFNPTGGTVSPTTKTVTYDGPYGDMPVATREDYKFIGWSAFESATTGYESTRTYKVVGNSTLYAIWNMYPVQAIKAMAKTTTPNFALTGDTDEGVFMAPDDYGTSYYFRGAVENNFVSFAGSYWKVVRVNGNNSLRIIYSGQSKYFPGEWIEDGAVGYGKYNTGYNVNTYFGYMYGSTSTSATYAQTTTNTTSSNIKSVLDEWYRTNIANTSYHSGISDTAFCNDRSITIGGGYGTSPSTYGAYTRLFTNKAPSFKCKNKNDRFTVSDTTNGNGKLTYPIGVITADELAYAGMVYNTNASYNNYLAYYGGMWTMSPGHYHYDSNQIDECQHFCLSGNKLSFRYTGSSSNMVPIINLDFNYIATHFEGGKGTYSKPWIIS